MLDIWRRRMMAAGLGALVLLLAACGSSPSRAPVEDRRSVVSATVMDPNTAAVKQPPGFENAGKAGYYTVKPGDTLIKIGLETGHHWKELAQWNNMERPNQLEVGQVIRVFPSSSAMAAAPASASADATTGTDSGGVVTRPISSASIASTQVQPGQTSSAAARPLPPAGAPASDPVTATSSQDGINWIWPSSGPVLAGFDELKNKGLDLGGKAGDPVLAAADGRVVYVGAGLRGYGNLIILKHNNTFLTAYAHNQSLLVKEDQNVSKGQKIAEMGNSDADRVKLHFEVRRQGKPVDPLKYLPAR